MNGSRRILSGCMLFILVSSLLIGCGGTPTPTTAPTVAPAATLAATATVAPTQPPAATRPPATATPVPPTPTPKGPTVGGTVRVALGQEPDSLDPHKTAGGGLLPELGGALLAKDLKTGKFIPYLAESWQGSPDGLTWTFNLKKGVKFHDGSPLSAKDWVYTFTRAKDRAIKSPVAGGMLGYVTGVEAPGDYTLVVRLSSPDYAILEAFANTMFMGPLSQAAVEKWGDQYGRHPMGVGPFKFKEWITGQKIVLERNPDFAWGPPYTRGGPTYIGTLEFVVIPEVATQLAGLETGELDIARVQPKDLARIQGTGRFQTMEWLFQGIYPFVVLNLEKPPLDDVRVRQALNLAVDREAMIKTVASGQATIQYGPISASTQGYWSGVEKIGYGYDLARAKDLMKQAGYTEGAGGTLAKDGQPLKLMLLVPGWVDEFVRASQVLKDQWKGLGVSVDLAMQGDIAAINALLRSGDYQIGLYSYGYADASLMYGIFYSKMVGVLNFSRLASADMDKLLEEMIGATSEEVNLSKAADVQKMVVEQAFIIPLYTPRFSWVVSNRIKGATRAVYQGHVELYDAYVEAK